MSIVVGEVPACDEETTGVDWEKVAGVDTDVLVVRPPKRVGQTPSAKERFRRPRPTMRQQPARLTP